MQQGHVEHGEHQEPGGVEVGLHIDEEHASTRAPPGHRCKACKTYSCKLQLRRQRAAPEQCLGSRRCPHASWVPRPGGPRPGGSRACCRCPSWQGCTDAKSCAGALLLLWRASECRVLMAPPPPALGAAAATPPAATAPPPPPPAPSMPITESGAYLPITSGGWILAVRGDLYSPRFFLSYILKRCRKKKSCRFQSPLPCSSVHHGQSVAEHLRALSWKRLSRAESWLLNETPVTKVLLGCCNPLSNETRKHRKQDELRSILNSSVASLPAKVRMASSPPGCSDKKLVTSST